MIIMASPAVDVVGGVDTHRDLHTAAVITTGGEVLGARTFPTTRPGSRAMLEWFAAHGTLLRVGVEGTGTFGAGITRYLAGAGVAVLEVTGPDPQTRRAKGKDDTLDAIAAATAALTGRRVVCAKDRSGAVEALRVLRATRKTAIKGRRVALQHLRATIVAAPDEIRDRIRSMTRMQLIRHCAAWRPATSAYRDPVTATRIALRSLARRILELNDEVAALDELIDPLVAELAPALLAINGVGTDCAAQFITTAGENPERLTSEAAFAMLCGAAPLPASSGKTNRHRLNRGGNRQANSALHMIVTSRMRNEPRTQAYAERRLAEGLSKRDIMRCLKRYVAREIYTALTRPTPT